MKLFTDQPFYKGNLHLHTTRSDGKLSPDQATALYREAGYDFLAITDHWKLSAAGQSGDMLLLPGVELDFTLPEQVVHLVCLGLSERDFSALRRDMTAQQAAGAVRAAGGRVILAHPAWSLNTPEMIASLGPLTAAEVYNTMSGPPWNADRANSSGILDVAAAGGTPLPLVAADDSHFYNGEALRAYTMVQADSLTAEGLYAALDAGRFYASCGPRFHQIEYDGQCIGISCSPVERIIFYSNSFWVPGRCRDGQGMTEAQYQVNKNDRFVRCELIDERGKSAWCNPIAISRD